MAAPGALNLEEEIKEVKMKIKKKEEEEVEAKQKLKELEEGSSKYISAEKDLDHTRKVLEGAQKILMALYKEKNLLRSQAPPGSPSGSDRGARISDVGSHDSHSLLASTARRFVGLLPDWGCATFVEPGWLVTYAHDGHAAWQLGQQVQVKYNHGGVEQGVSATVAFKCAHPGGDFVLLRVPGDALEETAYPTVEASVMPGLQFLLVGASGSCQSESPASVRHGVVTSARLDRNSHMVGDCKPQRGDSGAGCFLVATGALFAICMGCAGFGGEDAALLPIAIPQSKIRELEAGQSVQP